MEWPTSAVVNGLRALAASATSGGPEDIGLDAKDSRTWRQVQAACIWVLSLPERRPRRVTVDLTPAEFAAMYRMVDNSWGNGEWAQDYLKHDPPERRAATSAYHKLQQALARR